ncbi:hypothetical protein N7453_005723 [Penicillium expansum]|nr:hypothetical protein N7453_005723 [Penicillium expansum]
MRRMLYFIKRGQNEGTSKLEGFKANMGGFARPSSRQWVVLRVSCSGRNTFSILLSEEGVVVECEYAAINKAKRGRLAVQGHGEIGVLEESKATGQSE